MTIEQLLDFNQGNLYPKITNIKESYVSVDETTTGIDPFIADIFDGFDSTVFKKDNNKITLQDVVPGKIKEAATADKVASALTIKTGKDTTQSFDGSQAVTIEKVLGAETADAFKGALTFIYKDVNNNPHKTTNWQGDDIVTIDISDGISDAYAARHLRNETGNELIKGKTELSSILLTSSAGNISALDPSTGTANKVLLSVTKNGDGYEYDWVSSAEVGGAQIKQAENNTNYYILGATAPGAETIYGNFGNKSPYFKNANLYQTSDATLKTFTEDLDVDLDNLASIKKGLFYWNNDEEKVLDLGVSAQSVEPLFPQVVSETDGIKAVSYSKLSVIALAAIDKLYIRIKELEDELEKLKAEK